MINILFFIESLTGGGAEKVLCSLVNAMDRTKFNITVQTLYRENPGKYLAPGIRFKYCYLEASAINRLRMRAEAALGLTYPLHIRGGYDIEAAYLECGATKIIAGSNSKNALKLAWVHCDLKRKTKNPEGFVRETKKWYSKFDKVICVSENVRESFEDLYGDTAETAVLHNAVDSGYIIERSALPLPDNVERRKLTVLSVGRLAEQKGYMRLLRAHKRLVSGGLDHELWIAGEGPERAALEEYIRENGLDGTVKLLGFIDNPYPVMKAADVLVCSSFYEGFSTFVTEGLILGRPVVTTDCTGMRELLGDSEYGLVTENSENGLYNGIRTMLADTEVREKYGRLAEIRGRDFKLEKLVGETERFLEDSLRDKLEK